MKLIGRNEIKNVESGCDGISCAQIALSEEFIDYENYFATETDVYAKKITQHNFPKTIQCGDFKHIPLDRISKVDLLIAGVPCQGGSNNEKKLEFNDPRSLYEEFFYYKKNLREDAIFVLENVGSMSDKMRDRIDLMMGVKHLIINSNEFCAQNRERYFWTNIPVTPIWNSKEILGSQYKISDILEKKFDKKKLLKKEKLDRQCFYPSKTKGVVTLNPKKPDGTQTYQQDRIYDSSGKYPALLANIGDRNNIKDCFGNFRKLTVREQARLQTIPDWFDFSSVTDAQASKCIGNAMTVKSLRYILKFIK